MDQKYKKICFTYCPSYKLFCLIRAITKKLAPIQANEQKSCVN